MALDAQTKQALIKEFQLHETDTAVSRGSDCNSDQQNRIPDRTFKTASEGSSFPSWYVKNGWSASFSAELCKIQRR